MCGNITLALLIEVPFLKWGFKAGSKRHLLVILY